MAAADFYIMFLDDDTASWRGTLYNGGSPLEIPPRLLAATSEVEFMDGIKCIQSNPDFHGQRDKWPWRYDKSTATEWSYILVEEFSAVYITKRGNPANQAHETLQYMHMLEDMKVVTKHFNSDEYVMKLTTEIIRDMNTKIVSGDYKVKFPTMKGK